MAQQTINVGTAPNDGTGTPLRTAFQYTNSNFSELYTAVGPSGNNIVVPGSATITGDLTVDTSTLKVDSANNRVGIGTASPAAGSKLHVDGMIYGTNTVGAGLILFRTTDPTTQAASPYIKTPVTSGYSADSVYGFWYQNCGISNPAFESVAITTNSSERYRIDGSGIATWSNVGGVAGTAMTLNSTGLGVGLNPSSYVGRLVVGGTPAATSGAVVYVRDTFANGSNNSLGSIMFASSPGSDFYVGKKVSSAVSWFSIGNANSGAEYFQIDSSGNVGVGVTPTVGKVQTNGAFVTTGAVGSLGTNPLGNALIADFSTTTRLIATGANTTTAGVFKFINASSNASVYLESMTLDASGRLLVNTASVIGGSGDTLQIAGKTTAGTDYCSMYTGTSTTVYGARYYHTSAVVGSITFTASGTAYNIASDYRLKESVKPLFGGLDRINALKPSTYKWKVNGSDGEGFIAHELAEVIPAAVTGKKDAVNEDGSIQPQQVDLSKVVPVLVAAIQELTARVQTLETR